MAQLESTAPEPNARLPSETADPVGGVRSVQRAFALIRCLTPDRPAATLTEFTQCAGLATSTVQRLLTTLEAGAILRRLPEGRYTFGSSELVVSRGLGVSGLPLRVACPPEAVLVTLRGLEVRSSQ